jgi:F-type H+-transporting ATPase subunit epsilon
MLPATFKLEIATPERLLVSADVKEAQIPGEGGYLGILPGHAPLLSALQPGVISYPREGHTDRLVVTWGYVEVLPTKVTVLAEAAEKVEEIDVARAEKSLQRALDRLKQSSVDVDVARAQAAVRRATARLHVVGKI